MPTNKTSLENVVDWVIAGLGTDFTPNRGNFIEDEYNKTDKQLIVSHAGGPQPIAGNRYPRFELGFLTARANLTQASDIERALQLLMDRIESSKGGFPCGASAIRVMGEPIGPVFTTENRAYYSLMIDLIY